MASRVIGEGHPCLIIAEAGVNHNGNIKRAFELVDVAVNAGADVVKFQTFIAERLVAVGAPKALYQKVATGSEESQLEMLKRLELSFDNFRQLKEYCESKQIMFMSTPFDAASVDFLDELGVVAFKVPSSEIVNHDLLRHIAMKRKPVIMSTGMSFLSEVEKAVEVVRKSGYVDLVLLHCVSNYPAQYSDANLRAMETMVSRFSVPVGYSDHTLGIEVALAAVALGACVIEKHFTLDKNLPGPDHRASLDPNELSALVAGIRIVEQARGHGEKCPAACEENTRIVSRRSLVLTKDLRVGDAIGRCDVEALRSAGGISPDVVDQVIGKRMVHSLKAGSALSWSDFV